MMKRVDASGKKAVRNPDGFFLCFIPAELRFGF